MNDQIRIWALGGESLTAPENTIPAYWAALGAGAGGLAIGVRLTSDGEVVCSDNATLKNTCNDPRKVSHVTTDEVRRLDAGQLFCSTVLNVENQTSGNGNDTPWAGKWLYHPKLSEVLVLFSRRTELLLFLHPNGSSDKARKDIIKAVASLLVQFGLDRSTIIACDAKTFPLAAKSLPEATMALVASDDDKSKVAVTQAKKLKAARLIIRAKQLLTASGVPVAGSVSSLGSKLRILVASDKKSFALNPAHLMKINGAAWLDGVICRAVHQTLDAFRPPCKVLIDDFRGKKPDKSTWKLGYSKKNGDTKVYQDDGLIIKIKKGGEYSGGAALTTFSIHGDFDARIEYHVTNPHQATTFELAAIHVNPGYRDENLTFDVHGAPPYASSERDEDDGFRIGWNNGPALTKFSPTKLTMSKDASDYTVLSARDEAQSSNLYNEYSRDVGYGQKDSPDGELRLVRTGTIFNAYYKDKFNPSWVFSGSALVPTLAEDVFIRLGAKHWIKPRKGVHSPPENTVTFKRFELFQRRI